MGVSIGYHLTPEHAKKQLHNCQLHAISMPIYRAQAGIGDEAYVLTNSHLLFRIKHILFEVDSKNDSLDIERRVAAVLVDAVNASEIRR